MTHRTFWAAAVLFLVAVPAGWASESPDLEASLVADHVSGTGSIRVTGAIEAATLPAPATENPPKDAQLEVGGAEIQIQWFYRDYVGTPATLVGKSPDTQTGSTSLRGERLALADIRAHSQIMVVPRSGAETGPILEGEADTAVIRPQREHDVSLFPTVASFKPPEEFDRRHTGDHDLASAMLGPRTIPSHIRGDFTVYLWEVDVTGPSQSFQSGIQRSDGAGKTDATPNGAAYDARIQLLAIHVTAGDMAFLIPGRALEAHFATDHLDVESEAEWRLEGTTGDVVWGGTRNTLTQDDLLLQGTFSTRVEAASTQTSLLTTWSGHCAAASSGTEPLAMAASVAAPLALRLEFLVLVGASLVAAGAGSLAWRRADRLRPDGAGLLGVAARGGAAVDDAARDELMERSIRNLQEGRAQQVVDELEPGFHDEDVAASVKAYLLSLAYLKLDATEAAADWFLRATHLYPEFLHELDANPQLAPLRGHPRVRARTRDRSSVAYA